MIENYLRAAFVLVATISGIPLVVSAISGLIVAILQAATQVQEQTSSYLVKFSAVSVTLVLFSGWIGNEMLNFTRELFNSLVPLARGMP